MKLYWRVKINGKWTFKAADTYELDTGMYTTRSTVVKYCYGGLRMGRKMRLKCRKCGIVFTLDSLTGWQDIEDIQMMTCGGGGTHRLVGAK